MKKYVKICSYDSNSVSLFDKDRKNEFGEMYCVAPAILENEIEDCWNEYVKQEEFNQAYQTIFVETNEMNEDSFQYTEISFD